MTAGKYNLDWYFNNTAFYPMIYNLNNFKDSSTLTKHCHPKDNMILANGSVILLNKIATISLRFHIKDTAKKIFPLGVWYLSKLDINLGSLGMLDWKNLSYLLYKGLLKV